MSERTAIAPNANFKGRTGPPKKERIASQFTITMEPELYDWLIMTYMKNNGLNNRSGAIAKLLRVARSALLAKYEDGKAD